MSFYLECFDKNTGFLIIQYRLKNVTVMMLQDFMNVSDKRKREDPEYILSWRNNKISKKKIYFFENLLYGRIIDLNKYSVQLSNLDDSPESLKILGEKDKNVTFCEPPDWLTKKEINRINYQLEEEKNKEKFFQKRIYHIKKMLVYILNEIKDQEYNTMLVPNYRNQNKIFEIDIGYAFRLIDVHENYILSYESILLSLEEFSYKLSGKAVVKLLELGLIFKYKIDAREYSYLDFSNCYKNYE